MSVSGAARDDGSQSVQTISRSVTFATVGIGTADTVKVGRIPAGSQIISALVRVVTVFNATSTNVLTVGTSSGSDADLVNAGDVDEGTVGTTLVYRGCDMSFTSDTDIYVKYAQTGTAASTGAAVVVVSYISLNNG